MEDIKKLPKWAQFDLLWENQYKIEVLERNLQNVRAELRQIYGTEETNISFSKSIGEEFNLPKNARITFKLKPARRYWIDCLITNEESLRVTGENRILIYPMASNTIFIDPKEY